MSKTRLTNADRDAICGAILNHRFDRVDADLAVEENALAIRIRAHFCGDFLATMEAAPKRAFAEANSATFTVDGKRMRLCFGGDVRLCFADYTYSGFPNLSEASPLGKKVMAWANKREASKADRASLRDQLRGTLSSFHTFEALVEEWPEAASFANAQWVSRGTYKPQLPALPLRQLSAALDLPPEIEIAA